jgi:hypothetical protein
MLLISNEFNKPHNIAGNFFQIFNLELRTKVSSCTMLAAVIIWRWISIEKIVLVTAHAVFHWSIQGAIGRSSPVQSFERHSALSTTRSVINYQVSDDSRWFLLTGLKSGTSPGTINGTMQLYNKTRKPKGSYSAYKYYPYFY